MKIPKSRKGKGFTVVETVVTVVIIAILSGYAIPKIFGLKDQAKMTDETMVIKRIEQLYAKDLHKTGKAGGTPTLSSVVGYRPVVDSEPAPDEAEVFLNYGFAFTDYMTSNSNGTGYIVEVQPVTSPSLMSCAELSAAAEANGYKFTTPAASVHLGIKVARFEPIGENLAVPASATPPTCRVVEWKTRRFYTTPAADREYVNLGIASQTSAGAFYATIAPVQDKIWVERGAPLAGNPPYKHIIAPAYMQATCAPYTAKHGVQYELRNVVWTGSPVLTSVATTDVGPIHGLSNALSDYLTDLNLGSNAGKTYNGERLNHTRIQNRYLAYNANPAKCVRVGPAPDLPPSDPGDPGAYPMAADGSGYCVAPGRKLPTYKDGNGTPTASPSDPVVELATEAVDDATNCP